MITDIDNEYIAKDQKLNNFFLSATLKEINQNCKILKDNFFIDSFNYFPITNNYKTFFNLFKKEDNNSVEHFYTEEFYKNLLNNKKNFKIIENSFILGSSPADNYFSNLIHFLPRIFFINEKKINLVIHRNLANKFRNLIKIICDLRNIDITFNFIDDDFYQFKNSKLPQFFNTEKSIKILQFFFEKILNNIDDLNYGNKIYVRRENSNYRKILNEADLIDKFRKNGFKIFNPNHFEIIDQIKIFSKADVIVSPHGSNLSNIIFCKKDTKVYEIGPNFDKSYEINILNRYKYLASLTNLKYFKLKADSVEVANHSKIAEKFINKKVLNESSYYKNMIIKINQIEKLFNEL